MQELIDFVSRVGFPIAVALFVLIRLNGKLDRLVDALHRLTERIEVLIASRDR